MRRRVPVADRSAPLGITGWFGVHWLWTFREGGEVARTKNTRSITRTLATVALASAATLGLSACGSGGGPGTAFIVNGQSFSEDALTQTVSQWGQLSGVDVPRDEMASYLIETQMRLQAAREVGVELNYEDVQATLEGALAELPTELTADQITPAVRDMFADLLLVNTVRSGALSNEEIMALDEAINHSAVTVNPRYGTFTQGTLNPPGDLPGSVSADSAVDANALPETVDGN